jgi:hypothetical protein
MPYQLQLHLLLTILPFTTPLHLRSDDDAGSSPLNNYFMKDNQGMTIFDYAAVGTTPDEENSPIKIETQSDESANPDGKSTLQAVLEKVIKRQDETQEYFTGRKVFNDCKTFPYCNHIPAPPPVLPPPSDLAAPNPNIWYPWMPRIKSQGEADMANQDVNANANKKTLFHPWYHHRDIGQKYEHDINWDTPFERPGIVPRLYNRQYQLHMYPMNIGAIAKGGSGPAAETPPNGAYASGSETLINPESSFKKPGEATTLPKNVGQRGTGKYSKRRRSNVAVIIVRIIFISSFLFYCLLLNHSFQTNPNKITNCFKLFSLLQLTTTLLFRRFLLCSSF